MPGEQDDAWASLWRCLDNLSGAATRLRRLSQQEPLLQARADYPRARIGRSHADEVQQVLSEAAGCLTRTVQLLPRVFPGMRASSDATTSSDVPEGTTERPAGIAADETPREILKRLETLARTAADLQREAFLPPPPLPRHAPPYLASAEPPGHDMAGTKAILLSLGIESTAGTLRNALLGLANAVRNEPAPAG
jgi:hypothetical protein